MAPLVFQLSGTCNNYPWGRVGQESLAAKLCSKTPGVDLKIENDKPYSEMWFGDYPDFPARKLDTQELLSDVLQANKEQLLGKKVIDHFDGQLPFLPKILSIAKALPLQLHPSKELAAKLHKQDPDNFTDPNHKPEIAVALSRFEVFAGFKPLPEIEPLFKLQSLREFDPSSSSSSSSSTPNGGNAISEGSSAWTDETLREVAKNLLKADSETVKRVQKALSQESRDSLGKAAYILDLLPRLQDQYGSDDAGNLVALICMNFLVLEAGEAIYIPADGIHAYLSGDIVECMARSNNVLNAGFCPPADRNNIDMFVNTLTFKSHSKKDVYLPSKRSELSKNGHTFVYKPPMSEFDMLKTGLENGDWDEISASEGPAVMIVTAGSGRLKAQGNEFHLREGFIFFIAPGVSITLETTNGMEVHTAVI